MVFLNVKVNPTCNITVHRKYLEQVQSLSTWEVYSSLMQDARRKSEEGSEVHIHINEQGANIEKRDIMKTLEVLDKGLVLQRNAKNPMGRQGNQ